MKLEELKPGVIEAIEAMLAMDMAIRDNDLSMFDLAKGLALAIEGPRQGDDGHDLAIITTLMMVAALKHDKTAVPCTP